MIFLEIIALSGWRSVVVALLSIASLAAWAVPATRTRAAALKRLSLSVGGILTIDLIGQGLFDALHAESPGGLAGPLVEGFVVGLGPLATALIGVAVICALGAVAPRRSAPAKPDDGE